MSKIFAGMVHSYIVRMGKSFATALFLSGCAALVYQVTWQRVLAQLIGSDAVSMVLVVTIFMICLGAGSELAKYFVAKSEAQALKLYVYIEAAVGIYGIFSIPLLRKANYAAGIGDSLTFDFMLNLLLLSFPIIGMGLTTPLIVHVAKEKLQNIGSTAGGLYGWNIAGASVGAVLTGLIFIELVGLTRTTFLAAAFNFIAAFIVYNSFEAVKKMTHLKHGKDNKIASIPFLTGASAILFGFGTLAIQIIFFRVLSNYFTLSTVVFPMILCSYLCLMAFGQWVGGRLADKYCERLPFVVAALFATGATLFLAALRFPPSWAAALRALRFTSFNGQLVESTYSKLVGDPSPLVVFLFSLFFMSAVIAWSALFPVMFRLITERIEEAGNRFARMYTLYTVGNILGAFLCGIFLFPLIGTGGSATTTVLLVALGCFILLVSRGATFSHTPKHVQLGAWAALFLGTIAAALIPQDYYKAFKLGNYSVIDVFEGRTGVATVVPTSRFYDIIDINRTASASAMRREPEPSDLFQAWRFNHTDLMALEPAFRPKTILIIGIGNAYLIRAMLDLPFVEKITIIDISAEVVDAVEKYNIDFYKKIFIDPRVEILIADGRRYVQWAIKNGKKFDLIQNKINEPWHAGGGNLFTEEFFQEEKLLLSPGGYLSTRPLTGHLTDGLKIFGNAMWVGFYHMYFKNGPVIERNSAIVTPDIMTAWFADLPGRPLQKMQDRGNLKVTYFYEVPKEFLTDSNTDDSPTFEYFWLRQIFGTWVSPRLNFWDLDLSKYTREVPVLLTSE